MHARGVPRGSDITTESHHITDMNRGERAGRDADAIPRGFAFAS
jgi:hypothetical protein